MSFNMERFNLLWKGFESCATNTIKNLYSEKSYADVTLACDDDKQFKAHKVIMYNV